MGSEDCFGCWAWVARESLVSMTRSGFQVYQGILGDRRFEDLGGPLTSRIDCDKQLGRMSWSSRRSQVAGRRSQSEVCGSQRTDLVLKKGCYVPKF